MKIATKKTTSTQPAEILASQHVRYIRGGMTIDQNFVRLDQFETGRRIVKAGTRLGKITASGLFAPVRSTTLSVAALTTDTTITVVDARFFMAGEQVNVNGTNATISSINYTTNVITLTAQIGAAKAIGDTVKATNGLGTAVAVLYPDDIDVTDGNEAVGGIDHARVIEARCIGTVSASEKTDLKEISWA